MYIEQTELMLALVGFLPSNAFNGSSLFDHFPPGFSFAPTQVMFVRTWCLPGPARTSDIGTARFCTWSERLVSTPHHVYTR